MRDVVERAKAALEALGDKGPWTIDSEDGEPIIHEAHHYDSTDEWYDVDGANGGWVAHCEDLPVAEFIAQARSLVPELIAEVERLTAALAELHPEGSYREYVPAYRAENGNVIPIGSTTVLAEFAEKDCAQLRSPEDRTEIFVAYRDTPRWSPVAHLPEES
ncbi:hypothetical protein SEA_DEMSCULPINBOYZ_96 [Mycobacterium phage Demsculpinboyz]|uniref:Uncharacterized protein n=1 Tax=Mycobacterium phage Demsculpinboyz TaxID=2041528 RepID=A0A2D1G9Y5_9CAUD|nr:hypothetical protein I5I02_gp096 [Mycobacterium phage Demsculpinboyz]ATN88691.1 hypothetical protein SEA_DEMSCULPINBOYZ_96 [Mycobacterium phage Demsculpinboyz]